MSDTARRPLSAVQQQRLRNFALQTVVITAVAAVVTGVALIAWTRGYILEDYADFIGGNARDLVNATLPAGRPPAELTPQDLGGLERNIQGRIEQGGVVALRITDSAGRVVYSTGEEEPGTRGAPGDAVRAALDGETSAEVFGDGADAPIGDAKGQELVYVVTPWRSGAQRGQTKGAIEVLKPYRSLSPRLARPVPVVWTAVFIAALFVWLGVVAMYWRSERQVADAQQRMDDLTSAVEDSLRELEQESVGTLTALNAAVDAKDSYTAGHCLGVTGLACRAGAAMGLGPDAIEVLERASLLHDIGKIGSPEYILLKPRGLTPEEYEVVKEHSQTGARIIASIPSLVDVAPLVRWHHERWDGDGYPDGLAGEQIPLLARVLATADALDAMTSNRPYRSGMSQRDARRELVRCSGTQFDPAVVDVFVKLMEGEGLA